MFLRSALFNLVMWTAVAIYAPLSLLTAPLPYPWRYRFIIQWTRFHIWLARWLLGITYQVEGLEHLPSGAAVVLSKHQSAWETLAFPEIFPRVTWILKRELLWIPLFGWALALLRPVAIDRGAARRALKQVIAQGSARLAEGTWVGVFPEGTRVAPGERRPYQSGGALLAAEAGYPVVPVAHNAGRYWPRRSFVKRPGTVRVVIGPPIQTQGRKPQDIIREAEAWIEQTMTTLDVK